MYWQKRLKQYFQGNHLLDKYAELIVDLNFIVDDLPIPEEPYVTNYECVNVYPSIPVNDFKIDGSLDGTFKEIEGDI